MIELVYLKYCCSEIIQTHKMPHWVQEGAVRRNLRRGCATDAFRGRC